MDSYITYNPNTKEITGAYLQELPEDVQDVFLVSDDVRANWPLYIMNEDCTGLLLKPVPESPPTPVPAFVTRRQARQALLLRNLLHLVEPAIAAIPDELQRGLAQIEWEDATDFERNRTLVIQIGMAIGLDSAGLDELFIFAATL